MAGALQIRRAEAATQLILNRPEKANALTFELVEDLIEAVETALRDGTRLLVLRGEGKNFCGGFDFSDFEQQSDGDLLRRFVRLELLLQALYHAPIATLALCHGGTYGAGADLVAACDRRVAAPDTTFRMPGLRFGIALGTRRLAHRIGADHALEILASSRVFDAQEAQRIGLVGTIAALDAWGDIVRDVATGLKLDAGAASLLKSRVQADTRAADLAALAESAAAPGLKARIRAFRSAKG
jgi:enoyl-CoA hydratase